MVGTSPTKEPHAGATPTPSAAHGAMPTGSVTPGATDRAADGVALSTATTPAIQLHYLHPDHLGTPRLATDSAQRIVWRWDSAPFGDTPALEDPDGDGVRFTLNLRFPGQYLDAETGLHYNYYRDYDPVVGRYLESDPIGLRGGVNTYGYAYQNPMLFTDPTGEWAIAAPALPVIEVGCAALGSFLGVTVYHIINGATDCGGGGGASVGSGCEDNKKRCKRIAVKTSKWPGIPQGFKQCIYACKTDSGQNIIHRFVSENTECPEYVDWVPGDILPPK